MNPWQTYWAEWCRAVRGELGSVRIYGSCDISYPGFAPFWTFIQGSRCCWTFCWCWSAFYLNCSYHFLHVGHFDQPIILQSSSWSTHPGNPFQLLTALTWLRTPEDKREAETRPFSEGVNAVGSRTSTTFMSMVISKDPFVSFHKHLTRVDNERQRLFVIRAAARWVTQVY